jgi:hypothetical protein
MPHVIVFSTQSLEQYKVIADKSNQPYLGGSYQTIGFMRMLRTRGALLLQDRVELDLSGSSMSSQRLGGGQMNSRGVLHEIDLQLGFVGFETLQKIKVIVVERSNISQGWVCRKSQKCVNQRNIAMLRVA